MAFDLDRIISIGLEGNASDLILKTGSQPAMKRVGKVLFLSDERISEEDMTSLIERVAPDHIRETLFLEGEADFAFEYEDSTRFRVNAFRTNAEYAMVMRQVKNSIPDFGELFLPERQFAHFGQLERGLIFITGITGSGKSTSLAALIDYINGTRNKHIVTLEDPIEYMFSDELSLINQRQVGTDTATWMTGLRSAMREAPDVLMLGEIRDSETMEAAISAAETGHLVFTTLHTINAVQTVERVMTFFPPHQHDLVRMQLSMVLGGVASQRLLPCVKGDHMVPAVEILMNTPRVSEILRTGATTDLELAMQEGADYYGTQTFNMSLQSLYEEGLVTLEEACMASDSPDDLRLAVRGINKGNNNFSVGRY